MIVLELSRSSLGFRIEFYTAMWSSGTELGIQLQNRTVLGQEYKPKLSEEEISFEWFLCHGIFFDYKFILIWSFYILFFTYIPWFQRQLPDWEFRFCLFRTSFNLSQHADSSYEVKLHIFTRENNESMESKVDTPHTHLSWLHHLFAHKGLDISLNHPLECRWTCFNLWLCNKYYCNTFQKSQTKTFIWPVFAAETIS